MKNNKTNLLHYTALAAILIVAFFFRAYDIDAAGYGNMYYASTVFSMLTDEGNFFFASFDPAGFVTVDKPPLGFWVQAVSAAVFGFEGWALMLPQIVSGVLACLVLYWLVMRFFGPKAGLLAAFILAVTPIAVAADRNNTIDAQLLLALLLSAAALVLAVEKGSFKWLALGAVFVGLGFNIKMLQAYMILPAFYGLYFLAARTTWTKRILHLAGASLILIVVSFAWVLAVDSISTDQRPFIGSSEDNTVMELIVGHNGLRRMGQMASWVGLDSADAPASRADAPQQQDGQFPPVDMIPSNQGIQPQSGFPPRSPTGGGPASFAPQDGQQLPPRPGDGNFPNQNVNPGGQAQNGPRQNETGEAGPLRLFNQQLVGQVSWLLPLAVLMLLALVVRRRFTWPLHPEVQFALFWGLWLIPMAIFFSYAGLFHRYYLEMMAPAVAALTAGGLVALVRDFAAGRWSGWLLPLGIAGSVTFEAAMMALYWPEFTGWSVILTLAFGLLSVVGLLVIRALPMSMRLVARQMFMLGLVALLIAPILWATTPLMSGDSGLPYAGPELLERNNVQRPDDGVARERVDGTDRQLGQPALIEFLEANDSGETFLVAGMRANDVAPIIIATGRAAMAIGGFSGSDPILTTEQFAQYVANSQVRFVLNSNSGLGNRPNNSGQTDIMTWVRNSCSPVTSLRLDTSNPQVGSGGAILYDCAK